MEDREVRIAPEAPPPSRLGAARHLACASGLQLRRGLRDLTDGVRAWPRGDAAPFPAVVGESRTLLWTEAHAAEAGLQRGKVHNLRRAARELDGTVVPRGGTFSFWKQVGRATRARGFAPGRQLQEGCLVPATGGGLCQLSNALYDAALQAGLEILERHSHSRIIPGSAAAADRDATVAWNYIDLRFRATWSFRLEVRLTRNELIVRIRREESDPAPRASLLLPMAFTAGEPRSDTPRSCVTCGVSECFRNGGAQAQARTKGQAAFLVDERWPEFERYLADTRLPGDGLAIPLDGARWHLGRYAWETRGYGRVVAATTQTLWRSWRSRRLGRYGAARLYAQIAAAASLAGCLAKALGPDVVHVCVAQSLLPFLWQRGELGGRSFEVLMTRLPLEALHARLDEAARRHPERRTLVEFRAPEWLVQAETEALAAAEAVVTPHREIAQLFPGRARLRDWVVPSPVRQWEPGRRMVFAGPTAARKGAYEVREAARRLRLEVLAVGSELEGPEFWSGVEVRRPTGEGGGEWLEGAAAVVQPALVEEQPRLLLQALATGVPVVATKACGIPPRPGLTLVPVGDADALCEAMGAIVGKG